MAVVLKRRRRRLFLSLLLQQDDGRHCCCRTTAVVSFVVAVGRRPSSLLLLLQVYSYSRMTAVDGGSCRLCAFWLHLPVFLRFSESEEISSASPSGRKISPTENFYSARRKKPPSERNFLRLLPAREENSRSSAKTEKNSFFDGEKMGARALASAGLVQKCPVFLESTWTSVPVQLGSN